MLRQQLLTQLQVRRKKLVIILYEDGNGSNVRDYVGAQRSTNLCHRTARLGVYTVLGGGHDEKYGDRLPELPEDVLIQKDSKRAFPVSLDFHYGKTKEW